MVTANRSWATRLLRRASASSDVRPTSAKPTTTSAMLTAIATTSIPRWRQPHMANEPARLPGPGTPEPMAAACQATRTMPMIEVSN